MPRPVSSPASLIERKRPGVIARGLERLSHWAHGLPGRQAPADSAAEEPGEHIDPLTGLLNRAGLVAAFRERAKTRGGRFSLLYIDLDRFEATDRRLGRGASDELLIAVAGRLRSVCGAADAIARIGGDEFAILANLASETDARIAGRHVIEAIGLAGRFNSRTVVLSASIGVSFFPDQGEAFGPLLGEAEAALYRAKYDGGGTCVVAATGKADRDPSSARTAAALPPRLAVERNAA